MKFAFIENRYKTYFWSAIAKQLQLEGCNTVWLVQNPIFTPSGKHVYVIPFPKSKQGAESDHNLDEAHLRVKSSDRYVNHFGGDAGHYWHYVRAIRNWLDREQPDVVVGESTLFHELLVIEECRARGIPFLHPTTPGYPGERFSIYLYDSKVPAGASQEVPDDAYCLSMAEAIRKREKIPDYMMQSNRTGSERAYPPPNSLRNRTIILRGYLRGERFNTPSPVQKWLLDRRVRQNLANWEKLAMEATQQDDLRYILYPMQMQPEANLDVWGREFRNQVKLIRQIGDSLPSGWHLLVKSNPKAKYEMSSDLIELLEDHPKVSAVPLSKQMSQLLNQVDLVVTVTGTVAIECVLSRKPVAQFGPGVVEDGVGCVCLRSVADIGNIVRLIEGGEFPIASDTERVRLVKRLFVTTFPGKVSAPVISSAALKQDNVQRVANTLLEVAKECV